MALLSGLKNLVLGKQDPGQAAGYSSVDYAALNQLLRGGLQSQARLSEMLSSDLSRLKGEPSPEQQAEGLAESQIQQQIALNRQLADDQRARAEDLVKQRGLGGTVGGLRTILNASRPIAEREQSIRAQLPGLKQDLAERFQDRRTSRLGQISGLVTQLGQNPIGSQYNVGRESSGRSGGLASFLSAAAPGIGQGIGYSLGGPIGGAFGGQVGNQAQQGISGIQGKRPYLASPSRLSQFTNSYNFG